MAQDMDWYISVWCMHYSTDILSSQHIPVGNLVGYLHTQVDKNTRLDRWQLDIDYLVHKVMDYTDLQDLLLWPQDIIQYCKSIQRKYSPLNSRIE